MAKTPETTSKKQLPEPMKAHQWREGQSGNPAGRPKGSRHQFSEAFLKDFANEWQEGGKEALTKVRTEDPATFLRVAASLLPKELNINEGESQLERLLEQYSISDLDSLIVGLCTLGNSKTSGEAKTEKSVTKRPNPVH